MSRRSSTKLSAKEELTSYAMIAGFIGFFIAYVGAEMILTGAHPYHWLVGAAGGLVAATATYGVSWLKGRDKGA